MELRRRRPITYILPTTGWATLLKIIARDCPPGSTLKVGTAEMERLEPLGFKHINLHGRYSFSVPEPIMRGDRTRSAIQTSLNWYDSQNLIPVFSRAA